VPFLLAQLVAPPLQNSPVRLPTPALEQPQRRPNQPAAPILETPIESSPTEIPPTLPPGAPVDPRRLPAVKGKLPYTPQQLSAILQSCSLISPEAERLRACAAALTSRLVLDGYVNTRVFVFTDPPPAHLQVVEGKIVELRVQGPDPRLNNKVQRWLRPTLGTTLHLPSLERTLQLLQRRPEIDSVRSQLSRLGSDPSQAVLVVRVKTTPPAWRGDINLRNDGSIGSGQARATATILRPSLLSQGDTLLFSGELDGSETPQLGLATGSLSYTYPLGESVNLTGAFGSSWRQSIELPPPGNSFSTTQWQGLGQIEWLLRETLNQRWSMALAYSGNKASNQIDGEDIPSSQPERLRIPSNGYLRFELNGSGSAANLYWFGQLYGLQGVSAATPSQQIKELSFTGIVPGKASAIGTIISLGWSFLPAWQLNLRGGGQVAFQQLTEPMRFSLGSDVGLRGLPGQLISGDNGWLGTAELSWTFWSRRNQGLQLVPFIGAGGVSTTYQLQGAPNRFSDDVGAGGVLVRWLSGQHWTTEIGWVKQFSTENNADIWSSWLLGSGLYAKLNYRF
jgi:hemolysin activation/secretion protein